MVVKASDKCVKCGGCVGICPVNALTLKEGKIKCSKDCIDCGACINLCPAGALKKVDKK